MSAQPARHPRIEVVPCVGTKRATQPHFLRLVASNGATLAHSQAYSTKANALRATDSWLDAMEAIIDPGTGEASIYEVPA